MKTRRILLPSLLALAAFQGTSYADLLKIGVSFLGRNNDQTLGVNDLAGVVPQADWNNLGNNLGGEPAGNFSAGNPGGPVNSGALFTDNGVTNTRGTSGVTLTLNSNDSWSTDGAVGGTNDHKLMKGIVKANGSPNTLTLTLHGLDSTKNYKFIAYGNENGGTANTNFGLTGAATYDTFFVSEASGYDGSFTRGTSLNAGARTANTDYVQWDSIMSLANGDLTMTMIHIDGTDGAGFAGFQLIELAPLVAAQKYWSFGPGAGTWDMNTTQNWKIANTAGASDATFGPNDGANFGDLNGSGARTVNIDAGGVTPGEINVVNTGTNSYTIGGGAILGAGALTKDGSAALTLSGANQFSGLVTIKHGTVNVGTIGDSATDGNLGKGTLISMGDTSGAFNAVLNYTGGDATYNRSMAFTGTTGGSVSIPAGVTLTLTDVSGSGPLTKTGNGTLTFTGLSSTHTGNITINAGTLNARQVGSGAGKLLTLNPGTTFNITGPGILTDARVLLLNGDATVGVTDVAGSYALTGDVTTSAVLTKTGNGRLELAGAVSLDQQPVISAGTLALTKENSITFPAGTVTLGSNQRLEVVPGVLTAGNPVTLNGGSLRVERTGLQAYIYTGGYDGNQWTDNMNGSAFAIGSYFAAAGAPAASPRTTVNAAGLTYGSFGPAAPLASLGVNDIDNVRAVFTGKIRIDAAGNTTFFTSSDDGSGIFIDGTRVVLNNAFQGNTTRQGTINLSAGLHDFLMYYTEGGGDAGMIAEYTPAGGVRQVIPNSILTTADVEDYTATPITVTAASTIESGAALAQMGALTLPANTLLTLNGSMSFTGTTLTGTNSHQVAVTGFNANASLGPLNAATNLTKTGNGNLVFYFPPVAGSTVASNGGFVVAGNAGGGNALAATPLTFNGGGFGMTATAGGTFTFTNPVSSTTNLTVAAGSFGNGNITAATTINFSPSAGGLVAPAGNTLTLRVNDNNFTMNVTPQVTGTGNIVTEEGKVNLTSGVNNVGGNFTNRSATVVVTGNLATNTLTQQGNLPNAGGAGNLGDNLIAGQYLPGSLTVNGNTDATSITTNRGTLSLNGTVTNTGALTGSGNGTMNLGPSTHTSATLTGNATLNANGTFVTPGALSITSSTANLNGNSSVSGTTLTSASTLKVGNATLTSTAGITANLNSTLNFDPGGGNTATLLGGDVSLDTKTTLRVATGTADLTNVAVHSTFQTLTLFNNTLGGRLIPLINNARLDPRNANEANQIYNGTQALAVQKTANLSGNLDFPNDGAFGTFFGAGSDTDRFTAAFVGRFRATATGTINLGIFEQDDNAAVWIDVNQDGTFTDPERIVQVGCCGTTNDATTPSLTAGQFYNIMWAVEDTGGGGSVGGRLNNATVNIGTPATGAFSYIADNGLGSNFQIDSGAELRVKSFDNVSSVKLANNGAITFSNKPSGSTASNASRITLTGANGTVNLGDRNVVTVGELVLGSSSTLTLQLPPGAATNGGRLVVDGNAAGATGVVTDIGGSVINVLGGSLIINTPVNGVGLVNATLSGTIGGNSSTNMPVNIIGSGTLAPGDPALNGGIGKLSIGGLTTQGNLSMDLLDPGTTPNPHYDQLSVTGSVDISGSNLALTLAPGFTANLNDVFKLVLNDSTDAVFGTFSQGSSITAGIYTFNILYNADYDSSGAPNDIGLVVAAVPEPGTLAIMLGGFATLIGLGRARRRR